MSKVYGNIEENENGWSFEGVTLQHLKDLVAATEREELDSIEEYFGDLAILPAIIKDLISEVEDKQ